MGCLNIQVSFRASELFGKCVASVRCESFCHSTLYPLSACWIFRLPLFCLLGLVQIFYPIFLPSKYASTQPAPLHLLCGVSLPICLLLSVSTYSQKPLPDQVGGTA